MSTASDILRDRYLQLWLNVVQNKPHATIHLHDSENNRFRVDDLKAPLGTYDRAIIRGNDINLIEWATNNTSYDSTTTTTTTTS
ncbi:hypothetical protein INT46_002529 [Mucor plumbeus]|uniref:Uncharacterized protein n=1 Tax=Mucor plumbeus TaxID=97098 RepID=A0A8H7R7R3_9FUNG|nr:hypothetical protein INT46_002529 [Mucor plumbeus]